MTELEQKSTETYPLLCRRCREEIAAHQHSDVYEICTDCYLRLDIGRFIDDPRHVPRPKRGWGWPIPGDPQSISDAFHAYQRLNGEE